MIEGFEKVSERMISAGYGLESVYVSTVCPDISVTIDHLYMGRSTHWTCHLNHKGIKILSHLTGMGDDMSDEDVLKKIKVTKTDKGYLVQNSRNRFKFSKTEVFEEGNYGIEATLMVSYDVGMGKLDQPYKIEHLLNIDPYYAVCISKVYENNKLVDISDHEVKFVEFEE